jgi:hypothetical protein
MAKVDEVTTPRTLLEASRATTLTEQEEERRAGTVQEKGEEADEPASSQDRPPSTEYHTLYEETCGGTVPVVVQVTFVRSPT